MRSAARHHWRSWLPGVALLGWLLTTGCATAPRAANERPFDFARDTLAFTNQLAWEYGPDAAGRWRGTPREPKPDYTLRCFPMSRAVKQFFLHARFDASQPPADKEACQRLVRTVMDRSPRTGSAPERRVVIPGYAGLREFSAAHEPLLKAECGSAVDSYLQRGHWRMVFPFFGWQLADTADGLVTRLRGGQPAVLHLSRFPDTGAINHAVVVFAVRAEEDLYEFSLYDPNQPAAPVMLRFDRAARLFLFERNAYFVGGPLHAYEVYHGWCY